MATTTNSLGTSAAGAAAPVTPPVLTLTAPAAPAVTTITFVHSEFSGITTQTVAILQDGVQVTSFAAQNGTRDRAVSLVLVPGHTYSALLSSAVGVTGSCYLFYTINDGH